MKRFLFFIYILSLFWAPTVSYSQTIYTGHVKDVATGEDISGLEDLNSRDDQKALQQISSVILP